jgi:hypothetical protein
MHLPGREAVQKRCLVYIADSNLGSILRILAGTGSPKEFAAQRSVVFLVD